MLGSPAELKFSGMVIVDAFSYPHPLPFKRKNISYVYCTWSFLLQVNVNWKVLELWKYVHFDMFLAVYLLFIFLSCHLLSLLLFLNFFFPVFGSGNIFAIKYYYLKEFSVDHFSDSSLVCLWNSWQKHTYLTFHKSKPVWRI